MPTKPLPGRPSLEHLKHQAKDLLRSPRTLDVCQRLREFHPRFRSLSDDAIVAAPLSLAGAQLAIAREYGFASWSRLKRHVENAMGESALPLRDRIGDPIFRRALDLLDAGDAEGLRDWLREHPAVARARVEFEGGNYFRNPALLEFVAENPARNGTLPRNAAQMAQIVIDAGGAAERHVLDSALDLAASSCVARESGVQRELIETLCAAGADPNAALLSASLYGEFESVRALLERGAAVTLPVTAALGMEDAARATLPAAGQETRALALALAAQHGRPAIVELLLRAGVDAAGYTPPGGHSHATPLHQAALAGHLPIVKMLIDAGARTDVLDILYRSTPLGWARHAGQGETAAYLESLSDI